MVSSVWESFQYSGTRILSNPPSPSRPSVCAFILGHLAEKDDLEAIKESGY